MVGFPCHSVIGFSFAKSWPWAHLPGFTRIREARDGASGMCLWYVLGELQPRARLWSREMDKMIAVLELTS